MRYTYPMTLSRHIMLWLFGLLAISGVYALMKWHPGDKAYILGIALIASLFLFVVNRVWTERIEHVDRAAGFILWQSLDHAFDFILYPAALFILGPLHGFLAMTVASLLFNLVLIHINKRTHIDWTFVEYLHSLPIIRHISTWRIGRLRFGRLGIFALISIKVDAFTAITFLYGKQVNLRTMSFWVLFLASHTLANAVWTGGWEGIFYLIRAITG